MALLASTAIQDFATHGFWRRFASHLILESLGMHSQWRYKSGDLEAGPISAKELKQLADQGCLAPDDLVRRDDLDKWVRAAKVQGLFTASLVQPPPPTSGAVAPVSAAIKRKYRWPKRIGLALVGCYVLGLVARPEDKAKQRQSTASQSASANVESGQAASSYLPADEVEKRLSIRARRILPKYEQLLQAYLSLREEADALHAEVRYADTALQLGMSNDELEMKSLLSAEQIKGWLALRESWGEVVERQLARAKTETQESAETQSLRMLRVYEVSMKNALKVAELDRQILESQANDLENATKHLREFQEIFQESTKTSGYKDILDRQAKYKAIFTEVSKSIKDLEKLLKVNEPCLPSNLTNGLHKVVGVTHMIDGDDHYLTNELNRRQCIVSIPTDQRELINYRRLDGPNQVMIDDDFRFVGNTKGRNAFGGLVNVEMYVCDPHLKLAAHQVATDYVAYQSLLRKFHGKYTAYQASVSGFGGVLRRLAGDEQFSSVVKSMASLEH